MHGQKWSKLCVLNVVCFLCFNSIIKNFRKTFSRVFCINVLKLVILSTFTYIHSVNTKSILMHSTYNQLTTVIQITRQIPTYRTFLTVHILFTLEAFYIIWLLFECGSCDQPHHDMSEHRSCSVKKNNLK